MILLKCNSYIVRLTTYFVSSYEPSSGWLLSFLSNIKYTISNVIAIVTWYWIASTFEKKNQKSFCHQYFMHVQNAIERSKLRLGNAGSLGQDKR